VRKLTINEGFFSLRTARFFPNLTDLIISCKLTPDRTDEISDQLLQKVKHLEISQIKDADFQRQQSLLKRLETAPCLLELTIDMGRHVQGGEMLESLIRETKTIKKLTVTNIQLMSSADHHKVGIKNCYVNKSRYNNAIGFLASLSHNKTIESLSLHFS